MALVTDDDVQAHLPLDKLRIDQTKVDFYAEYQRALIDSERIVRGELTGVFLPSTLASWSTPETTPQVIRAIASRLTAAFLYRLRVAEDNRDMPGYAQIKYDEAMLMLQRVASGDLILEEVVEIEGTPPSALMFYPDDSTPGPYFTMEGDL